MTEKDIQKYAKEIHQTAQDKGWWDKKRNHDEVFMLIITELAEAVEADRKNTYANYEVYDEIKKKVEEMNEKLFKNYFEEWIKDTVEDELADALIRALDYLYYRHREFIIIPSTNSYWGENFAENILFLTRKITDMEIAEFVSDIISFCEHKGIDIQWHVEQKMQYNGMRKYKHGGKKY